MTRSEPAPPAPGRRPLARRARCPAVPAGPAAPAAAGCGWRGGRGSSCAQYGRTPAPAGAFFPARGTSSPECFTRFCANLLRVPPALRA